MTDNNNNKQEKTYVNPWIFDGKPFLSFEDPHIGFVYEILCLENGKKYIGKKNFLTTKTKTVKGKKKRLKTESDWRDYYGSNDELKADVAKYGVGRFVRTILVLCQTKGEMSYLEGKLQFEADAILRHDYYNKWLMLRVATSHVKHLLIKE